MPDGARIDVQPLSLARTTLATLAILLATVVGRIVAMLAVGVPLGRIDPNDLGAAAERADGLLFCIGIIGAAAAGGTAVWAILRRRSPRRYLAFERPTVRAVLLGILASVALVAIFDAARWATTGVLVPAAWLETFASAESLPLLVLALVVVAPGFEEAFFRGFLHRGLAASRIGPAGAIAITSVLFTLAHGPEDALGALDPLVSAILLGVVRHRTGSIVPGITMHALGNLQAIVMVSLLS